MFLLVNVDKTFLMDFFSLNVNCMKESLCTQICSCLNIFFCFLLKCIFLSTELYFYWKPFNLCYGQSILLLVLFLVFITELSYLFQCIQWIFFWSGFGIYLLWKFFCFYWLFIWLFSRSSFMCYTVSLIFCVILLLPISFFTFGSAKLTDMSFLFLNSGFSTAAKY